MIEIDRAKCLCIVFVKEIRLPKQVVRAFYYCKFLLRSKNLLFIYFYRKGKICLLYKHLSSTAGPFPILLLWLFLYLQ